MMEFRNKDEKDAYWKMVGENLHKWEHQRKVDGVVRYLRGWGIVIAILGAFVLLGFLADALGL